MEQFRKVNGFPNAFWGWGGEDDDLWNRSVYEAQKLVFFSNQQTLTCNRSVFVGYKVVWSDGPAAMPYCRGLAKKKFPIYYLQKKMFQFGRVSVFSFSNIVLHFNKITITKFILKTLYFFMFIFHVLLRSVFSFNEEFNFLYMFSQ